MARTPGRDSSSPLSGQSPTQQEYPLLLRINGSFSRLHLPDRPYKNGNLSRAEHL